MKIVTDAYKNAVKQQVTTLTHLWRLHLNDGTIKGFTSFNRDIVLTDDPNVTYFAKTGFTPTAITTSEKFNVDNLDVEGYLDSTSITEADLGSGRYDFARIVVYRLNWLDKPFSIAKCEILRTGSLGEVKINNTSYTAEIRGLTQAYQFNVGDLYQPACRATLGDSKCKVNTINYTVASAVTAVGENRNITCSLTNPDKFFNNGKITFTSGLNNNLEMEVKSWGGGILSLQLPMNYTINIGDTFLLIAGCDKTKKTCKDIFNNVINFRGEPDMPGMDFLQGGNLQ
jgi:uncharacterized phage protein (TIGR02218 family)